MKPTTFKAIIDRLIMNQAPLLQVILAVQDANPQKFLSEAAIQEIAQAMRIPRGRVYSTASFYSGISLKPRGRHLIRVCVNAPCENAGKTEILRTIERELGITIGQTSSDGLFTLEDVNCLGACYLSPAIKVDDTVYGNLTPATTVAIIGGLRKEPDHE